MAPFFAGVDTMCCWIIILGGLIMMGQMGQHTHAEALFYYFRLEDQVPKTHLLRLIEKHITFKSIRLPVT